MLQTHWESGHQIHLIVHLQPPTPPFSYFWPLAWFVHFINRFKIYLTEQNFRGLFSILTWNWHSLQKLHREQVCRNGISAWDPKNCAWEIYFHSHPSIYVQNGGISFKTNEFLSNLRQFPSIPVQNWEKVPGNPVTRIHLFSSPDLSP